MDHHDLAQVQSELNHGKLLFLNTTPFFAHYQNDVLALKNIIDELKKMVLRKGGSIGRVGENILILSPRKDVKLF
jgi:SepF-like predicted cell division protein (DUF552 family)